MLPWKNVTSLHRFYLIYIHFATYIKQIEMDYIPLDPIE